MIISRECEHKDNIFNGAGLYLGTLAKYRAVENPDIRDEFEATFHFEINIPEPIKLSKSWCNALFNGTMRFERDYVGFGSRMSTTSEFGVVYQCDWREMNIVENDLREDYIIASARILFTYQVPNCLVLCMRKFNHGSMQISSGYKSAWFIKGADNIEEFRTKVAKMILLEIKRRGFMRYEHVSELDKLSVSSRFSEIDYTARESYTIRSESDLTIDRIRRIISESVFMKRPVYATDNEVRFAFQICYLGRPIIFPDRDMVLPAGGILGTASSTA